MEQDERELIEHAKQDPAFFGAVYTKYVKSVYRYLWARAGKSRELAEDLAQETFIRAFRGLKSFKVRGATYIGYLRTIARNLLISYYRKKQTVPLEYASEIPATEHDALERTFDIKHTLSRLQRLSPADRTILLMKYEEELSITDIAKKLKKTPSAVKSALFKARKRAMELEEAPLPPPETKI